VKRLLPCLLLTGLVLAPAARAGTIGTVFYIEMENHNFTQPPSQSSPGQIKGNPAAPYINSLITPGNPNAAQVSYATNYLNAAVGNHPSEPNYVWQEAGRAGPLNDNDPFPSNIVNAPNLSALLQAKYGTAGWRSYQEGINLAGSGSSKTNTVLPRNQWTVPLASFSGTSSLYTNPYNGSHQYNFAPKHDGQLFFAATNGGNNTTPSNPQAQFYAPLEQLGTDLANNTLARYNLITPDQFNDAHSALTGGFTYNGVPFTGDQAAIAQGDNFLSILVPQIMASQAYKNNGAIVIWWDETEGGDDPSRTIPEIVLSPLAKGNAYASPLMYTHSSDLKTLQELFGLTDSGFLGDAGSPTTNDLSDLFQPGAIPQATVPEPSTLGLCLLGGAGLAGCRFWRRRGAARSSRGQL
jgi:hypothetical protein